MSDGESILEIIASAEKIIFDPENCNHYVAFVNRDGKVDGYTAPAAKCPTCLRRRLHESERENELLRPIARRWVSPTEWTPYPEYMKLVQAAIDGGALAADDGGALCTFIHATVTINGRTFRAWVQGDLGNFFVTYEDRQVRLRQLGDGTFVEASQ